MSVDLKTARDETPQIGHTTIRFKHAIAYAATEVVVMPFAGKFIALRLARQFDRYQPALFSQRFERPVDRGNAQARQVTLSRFKNFLWPQRTICFLKSLPDRFTLSRISFHVAPGGQINRRKR
jgi:hypothetical protein